MRGSDLYFMAKWYILPFPVWIRAGTHQATIECSPLFKARLTEMLHGKQINLFPVE